MLRLPSMCISRRVPTSRPALVRQLCRSSPPPSSMPCQGSPERDTDLSHSKMSEGESVACVGLFGGERADKPDRLEVTRSEYRQARGSCDAVGTGAAGEKATSLRRETPANVRGSSRHKQAFFLSDRRSYDRSIAGLGESRAPRYFASDFDRSNRLTGWRVRLKRS
jgi:hypothetical protein